MEVVNSLADPDNPEDFNLFFFGVPEPDTVTNPETEPEPIPPITDDPETIGITPVISTTITQQPITSNRDNWLILLLGLAFL